MNSAFELGKQDIRNSLAAAEEAYSKALKEFTTKYDQYHMCLKDGDFETTITNQANKKEDTDLLNLFNLLFSI